MHNDFLKVTMEVFELIFLQILKVIQGLNE